MTESIKPPVPAAHHRVFDRLLIAGEYIACAARAVGTGHDPSDELHARQPMRWAYGALHEALELTQPGAEGEAARLRAENEELRALAGVE
ncbi:hypothetical protein HDIA_0161 [Hartmannibacter diazotrophicus]|uniref:Uncharacterized protein n=1 Tax=Hartmannibacter diazotrophicus TaxID=1482074 RepID=A0A2C9D042_9HYPH|nr:hypothetical protein [Hartmannibacter diazotrophicus]SON53702.1 hypothetical protein HDIA_0161 [Hartmannibacter diazotrophicus]